MLKQHFAEFDETRLRMSEAWCGQANAARTTDRYAVTCKRCLKLLDELSAAVRARGSNSADH